MHRSGTSALAGILGKLGYDLPKSLMPTTEDNPKGYFESTKVYDLNNRILRELGSNWADWSEIDPVRLSTSRFRSFLDEAVALIAHEFENASFPVVKDPRICRLYPFWKTAAVQSGFTPLAVIPFRDPLNVALSLQKRDDILVEQGLMLWLRHVLDAEYNTRDCPRAFVEFGALLDDWQRSVKSIHRALGIAMPKMANDAKREITSFLTSDFVHHEEAIHGKDQQHDWVSWYADIYGVLHEASGKRLRKTALARFDTVRESFSTALRLTGHSLMLPDVARPSTSSSPEQAADRLKTKQVLLGELRAQLSRAEGAYFDADRNLTRHRAVLARSEKYRQRHRKTIEQNNIDLAALREEKERLLSDAKSREELLHKTTQDLKHSQLQLTESKSAYAKLHGEHKALASNAKAQNEHWSRELDQLQHKLSKTEESVFLKLERRLKKRKATRALVQRIQKRHMRRLHHRDASVIRESGEFDVEYYLSGDQALSASNLDPIYHFVRYGAAEGRKPNPNFDPEYYLKAYPDVRSANINPFVHYVLFGQKEGRIGAPIAVAEPATWHPAESVEPERPSGHAANTPPELRRSHKTLVSVVVPNYNHAAFLRDRLDSIYGQTYDAIQVILIDDASTDGSQDILSEYRDRYPDRTKLFMNPENSGTPFRQWVTGIEQADGELICIAESDDLVELDFIEKVTPAFEDEAVLLAYGDIQFMSAAGEVRKGVAGYHARTGYAQWNASYVKSAHEEFTGPFGIKNLIVNVSGAVFRKPTLTEGFVQALYEYKICGDWLFYMHVSRGGRISYVQDAKAYFRQHDSNTSVQSFTKDHYYREHHKIALELRRTYGTPEHVLRKNHAEVRNMYDTFYPTDAVGSDGGLQRLYDLEDVLAETKQPLNILIGIFGFYVGGGELFPIFLANELKRQGHSVTVFALGHAELQSVDVRNNLRSDIPVLYGGPEGQTLVEVASTFGIDIINTHNFGFEWHNRMNRADLKPTYVVTHHGSYETSVPPIKNKLEALRPIDDLVDHWIYIADKNLGPFRDVGIQQINVSKFPNGMPNRTHHDPVDLAEHAIESDAFTLVLASRALPEKGWRHACNAVISANELSSRKIHLLLIGGGGEFDLLAKMDFPDTIHLLGYKNNVPAYYGAASCGLLPSFFKGESFPLSIIECLLAGKPFIASNVGEVEDMLTDDDGSVAGVVIPPRTDPAGFEADLRDAILKLADDDEFYATARQVAARLAMRYDIENVAEKYIALFKREHARKNACDRPRI